MRILKFGGTSVGSPESLARVEGIVRDQLESLAEWQRNIFEMRHFENLPIQEIADRMARSNDAVRSSLYRVKRLVVDALESEGSGAG